MNRRIHVIYGFILGMVLTFLGVYFYVTMFVGGEFNESIVAIKSQNNFGKVIALGSIPNLFAFFLLLKKNREMWARGVVLATIALAISTIFYL